MDLKSAEAESRPGHIRADREGAQRLICEAEAIENDPDAKPGYAEGDNLSLGEEWDEDEIRLEPLNP